MSTFAKKLIMIIGRVGKQLSIKIQTPRVKLGNSTR